MSEFLKKFIKPAQDLIDNPPPIPPNNNDFLDLCIRSVSDGQFNTYSDAVSEFVYSFNSYADKNEFLLKECGIVLDNEDSGSIIGKDARGDYVIGKHFCPIKEVPEDLPPKHANINGILIDFRDLSNIESDSDKTSLFFRHAYYNWIPFIIDKIYESFGLTVNDKIEVNSIPPVDFVSAHTNIDYSVPFYDCLFYPRGDATDDDDDVIDESFNYWAIITGTEFINNMDIVDVGRVVLVSGGEERTYYLDTELARVFVDVVFERLIPWAELLPALFMDGLADVFAGGDFRPINHGTDYIELLTNNIGVLYDVLVERGPLTDDGAYIVADTFLRWLKERFQPKVYTPFLNKLIYGVNLYDKFYADVTMIINLAIQYATKLTGIKTSYVQFIQEYVNKLDIDDIDSSLYILSKLDFTNEDGGAYGGKDSKFVDYAIKRQDRFRILNIFSYLNQADTLYYSFSYYAKYENNEYKVRDLTIKFTEITSSTINAYYKKSIISRLIRGIFKPVLQCLDYYLNLRFDSFSFCKVIHIDFDDDPTPIRPCSYQVGFDESGKVNSMLITFYTHAYIPIDDRDTMPAMGYYTGNYLLYIFCIFIILSKLNNAQAFYRHPIIVAIAITLVGYDELGETDIKDTAVNGDTEQYAVGGIIGD